jgi:hypothetical protein
LIFMFVFQGKNLFEDALASPPREAPFRVGGRVPERSE